MEGCDNNLAPPPSYNEDVFTTGSEGLSVPPPPTYVDVIQHREEYSSVGEPTSSSYLPDAPSSVPYPSPLDNPTSTIVHEHQERRISTNTDSAQKALEGLKCSFKCSIIAMCCFFPLGIVSFIKYQKARQFYNMGDYDNSIKISDKVFGLGVGTCIAGLHLYLFCIITFVIVVVINAVNLLSK